MSIKTWVVRISLFAAFTGLTAWLAIAKPWRGGAAKLSYTTVKVAKGNISAQVTATGVFSARSTVLVGAQVSGRVLEINADFNDVVTKGQIIARLDDGVLSSQLAQAKAAQQVALASVRRAEVALKDAERQFGRQTALRDQNLVAGQTVDSMEAARDTAKANLAAAQAQVTQANANVAQAKLNLSYATIYSPVDGVVLSRAVDVGQTVAASFQAPTLFTIAQDLSKMQIDTAVSEGDIGRLKDGMKAQFLVDAFPGKTFDGIVRQVRNQPTTTAGVVTYDTVIDVENPDRVLRPGMTANVTFVLEQVNDVIKLPNAALRFKLSREQMMAMREALGMPKGPPKKNGSGGMMGGQRPTMGADGKPSWGDKKMVWKLVAGKPEMVLIKPGLTDGSTTQVLEGELAPGDELITEVQGLPAGTRKIGAF